MNHLIRCCRGLAATLTLSLLFSLNAPAAPRTASAASAAKSSLAARGWCIDDLCLGQPEAALKPYAPRQAAARPAGACPSPQRRYAVARTDGVLEAAIDSSGHITELERDYSDVGTAAQFERMLQDTSRKLSAHVVSRDTHAGATVVRLHSPSAHADVALDYAPARAQPLTVRLSVPLLRETCEATAPVSAARAGRPEKVPTAP